MSIKVTSRVWEQSKQDGTFLICLLALSDWSNDDGLCWYGIEKIAARIRREERQTQAVLRRLEWAGELYTIRGGGRKHTNVYLVCVGLTAANIIAALTSQYVGMSLVKATECAGAIEGARARFASLKQAEKVQPTAPIAKTERVQSSVRKGAISDQKGAVQRQKGAVATAPEPYDPLEEPLEPSDSNGASAPTDLEGIPGGGLALGQSEPEREPEPEPKPVKTRDVLLDHWAVTTYRDLTHLTPNDIQRQMMVARVTDEVRWRAKVTDWLGHRWNKGNVLGMIEFYEKPDSAQRGNGHRNSSPVITPVVPVDMSVVLARRANAPWAQTKTQGGSN